MSTAPSPPPYKPEEPRHPLRTIREIRESLPAQQVAHFDAELADTDLDALPDMLHRWATLGNDGFLDRLISTPFEGLEFGGRSYDDAAGGE
ncbi:hypothetical protein [Streptomyces acidiscabies]|uniref:Uncharacterized protein n=1 Tax=Streptomyces acidiscabies TaxID=42234 RepID=A0A0L0JJZ9_9ACTN|nr:hypothetical protein [Streptomyces acidiscabies]KND26022.1 hypothetical protein IQ63_37900 [Streptomyces acidiscabies]